MVFLDYCSQRPEQKPFFSNKDFQACMLNTQETLSLYKEKLDLVSPQWKEKGPGQLLPRELSPKLLEDLNNLTELELSKSLEPLIKRYPQSTILRFYSQLEDVKDLPFLLIHIPNYSGEADLTINSQISNREIPATTNFIWAHNDSKRHVDFYTVKHDLGADDGARASTSVHKLSDTLALFKGDLLQLKCATCHQAGYLSVISEESKVTAIYPEGINSRQILKKINSQFKRNNTSIKAKLEVNSPLLGPEDSVFRTQFLQHCLSENKPESLQRIQSAMNCTKCHDTNGKSAPLSFPFGEVIPSFQRSQSRPVNYSTMSHILKNGLMPPKSFDVEHGHLNSLEQQALFECLMIEYFGKLYPSSRTKKVEGWSGLLINWLLEKPCPVEKGGLEGG